MATANGGFAEDRDRLAAFKVPKEPCYRLVGSLDSIGLLRRDLTGLLTEAARGSKLFEGLERFQRFRRAPRVTTGADRDLSIAARKGSRGLTEPRARARGAPEKCRIYRNSENALKGGSLADLPHHAIVDRGSVVGLWDFNPQMQELVWMSFVKKNRAFSYAERLKATAQSYLSGADSSKPMADTAASGG